MPSATWRHIIFCFVLPNVSLQTSKRRCGIKQRFWVSVDVGKRQRERYDTHCAMIKQNACMADASWQLVPVWARSTTNRRNGAR